MKMLRIYDRIQPVIQEVQLPVTEIRNDVLEKPSIWNPFQFRIIEKELWGMSLPVGPIELYSGVLITDIYKFIETSLAEINTNWGKYSYEPSLLRIIKLHQILTTHEVQN